MNTVILGTDKELREKIADNRPPRKLKLFINIDDSTKFKDRLFTHICKAKNQFPRKSSFYLIRRSRKILYAANKSKRRQAGDYHTWRLCWLVVNKLCIYNLFRTVTDIVHSLSRLSARSALLPEAEVSTGDPRPTAFNYQL